MKQIVCITIAVLVTFLSCTREGKGIPDAVGGALPTNFIIVTDAGFSPSAAVAVNGSTFTFVNQSGSTIGLYSTDSIIINKQNIPANSSYVFVKDTVGVITYFKAGKPTLRGSIKLTP